MKEVKNLIRVGAVSSVNYPEGRVQVCFEDQDNIVTDELPMLAAEYEMPAVGEKVLCLFLGNGVAKGFCLGRYFYEQEQPGQSGKEIYYKQFMKDASLKYDRSGKTMTLKADQIVVNGNLEINGNLKINGQLIVSEDATIGGISFLKHVHPYTWKHDPGSDNTSAPQ